MADSVGNYDLKVEFLDNNEYIDAEDEFRNFCLNLLEPPGAIDSNGSQPTSTKSNGSLHIKTESGDSADSISLQHPKMTNTTIIPATIKRVKPAFVQSLRPESSTVSDDDIRLSYAKLLFNTFNGLEKEDIGQKLRAMCVEDCFMSVKWIGEKGNPCGPNYRDVTGLNPVSSWLEALMITAIPDAVMQLQDSKLRVRPDKSSYLLCKYTFDGTQINKIEPVPVSPRGGGFLNSFKPPTSTESFHCGSGGTASGISKTGDGDSVSSSGAATLPTESDAKRPRVDTTSANFSNSSSDSLAGASLSTAPAAVPVASTSKVTPKGRNKRPAEPAPVGDNLNNAPYEATVLLKSAFKMKIVGTLIIHINPEKRIFKFEYIQKLVRLTIT